MPDQIAILIPCLNEEKTIAGVVTSFSRELPTALIYVFDNNSTDNTAEIARNAGALVREVPDQGKGNVVREMFRQINADAYVLVDGDLTYPSESVHDLLAPILTGETHMTVGDRISSTAYERQNSRRFHTFGNKLVIILINLLFNTRCNDALSGFRVFSRAFVESIPLMSTGFEVETELTLHCLDRKISFREIPIPYTERPIGSVSKLHTIKDGIRILKTIGRLFKDYKPLLFFTSLSSIFLLCSLLSGGAVISEYLRTSFITHVPLAILAAGSGLVSILLLCCGLILDTITRQHKAMIELRIASIFRSTSGN
jgi:glycosyltransferase involved in cell wall biosynthesis